jgi:broad specificity phosphatase PhoE
MTILLIRHGETALNAARVLQPADTPLSPLGERQAQALSARLAGMGLTAILSSDMPRAWQTAQAVAAATGLPIATSAMLHERNFGELRGLPYDTLGFDALTMDAPPGGETTAAFTQRVAAAFELAVALRATLPGPLAVVTHGLVIRAILERHAARPQAGWLSPAIGNTSLTILSAQPPHAVELLACTAHLEPEAQATAHGLSGG